MKKKITKFSKSLGEKMYQIYRVGLHIVYLLFAMVIAAFLHAPLLTRITIMGLVPLNLVSFLKHGMDACLDFVSISVLIFLITMSMYYAEKIFINLVHNFNFFFS